MDRWLAGRVFWPFTERLCGRDTMRRLRGLQATDRLAAEALRAIQTRKLRALLRIAVEHAPFHARRIRAARIDPHAPAAGVDVLRLLPALTREDVREHLDEVTWRDCPGGARPYSTGGSSGEPLKFYFDRRRQAADQATRWRARGWWGLRPGDHEVLLWGAPVELKAQDLLRRLRDALLNQRMLNAFHMTVDAMDAYLAVLRDSDLPPACLYGYPSSLALLARHAERRGLEPGGLGSTALKAVFVTGEVLAEADRTAIERAFAAPVVIEYGCRDGGLLACQCPCGRLHVAEENAIVEVLDPDGRPVEPGGAGEVVVTQLECHATLMIRYRTGDLAVLGDRACPCGRASLTLLDVLGRKTDQIVCPADGGLKHMHALALIYVLREAEGVRQFRVTQRSVSAVDVEIVPGKGYTSDVEACIIRGLRERLGPQVAVRLFRREAIAPGASGKHACVVSEIPGNELEPLDSR
ncbi:MAG: phenylacetate--CoA ligase family protein [Phycisphaerae bacterium]|jgi:phenylacetate-CoA ligase